MTASANNTIQLLTWDTDGAIYDPVRNGYFPTSATIYDSDGGSYSIPFDHNINPNTGNNVFAGGPFMVGTTTQGWYLQATDIYYPPGGVEAVDAVLCSQYLGGFAYPVTDIDVWNSVLVGTYGNYIVTAGNDPHSGSVSLTYYDIFGKLAPITRPVFYYDAATVSAEVSDITSSGGIPSVVITIISGAGERPYPIGAVELCPLVAPEEVRAVSTYTRLNFSADSDYPDDPDFVPYFILAFYGTYYYANVFGVGLYRAKALGALWEKLPDGASPLDAWVSPGVVLGGSSSYQLRYAAGDVALWEEQPSSGTTSYLVSADALGNTRYRTSFAAYTHLQVYATNTPLFWGGNSVLLER
jgi:hypothetical protein